MDQDFFCIDLHVHSKHSTRPSQWLLQRMGCPESFTEPRRIYDIARAVEDSATVPIYYESRLARIELDEDKKPKIDAEIADLTEDEAETEQERLKRKWASVEAVVGSDKDTGRVRLTENGCEIIADLAKKVSWDQSRMAEALATLHAWGESPADYVTTEVSVPESRFTAWPPRIRALFEPARTVAAGRPSYSLKSINP